MEHIDPKDVTGSFKRVLGDFIPKNYYMLRDLVSQLLDKDPNQRLGIESLLNHPFFDSISQQNETMNNKICHSPG